jgi:hypothetical protein
MQNRRFWGKKVVLSRAVHGGQIIGAGDRDRTGDIQLGKLAHTFRPTKNQALTAGHARPNTALSALIEHSFEHVVRIYGTAVRSDCDPAECAGGDKRTERDSQTHRYVNPGYVTTFAGARGKDGPEQE